eukprot:s2273_g11.t1
MQVLLLSPGYFAVPPLQLLRTLQFSPGLLPARLPNLPDLRPVKTSQHCRSARVAEHEQKATATNLRWKFGKSKNHRPGNEVGIRTLWAWHQ